MQLQSGTLLQGGKYKIERVLGQGGFGITYLATQELFDRRVCIKEFFFNDYCERGSQGEVTSCTTNSKELVDRFLNKFIKEARTISRLDHPNIVRILDIFQENGTAYYAMEYIEGCSLADKVNKQGALSEAVAVDYIKQVASALDYIHQRSINHLDVKPANIMVRQSDNKAILIDFGLSKQYDEQGGQTSTTPVGISHGYAPMEQYNQGGVSTFSPQTDIYALGATLYKLVTGNTPPQAIEVFNEGLTGLPQSLSPNLAAAIKKTIQPRRNDRPQSISEFRALLCGQYATSASSSTAQNIDDESTMVIGVTNSELSENQPTEDKVGEGKGAMGVALILVVLICLFVAVLTTVQQRVIQQPTQQSTENVKSINTINQELTSLEKKIVGKHLLSLQWISWEHFGTVTITKVGDNKYRCVGSQLSKEHSGDYLKLDGYISIVSETHLKFTGTIKTKVHHLNNGNEYVRKGTFDFMAKGGRKYWREQQMKGPDGVTDYIDIYMQQM